MDSSRNIQNRSWTLTDLCFELLHPRQISVSELEFPHPRANLKGVRKTHDYHVTTSDRIFYELGF